MNQKGQLLLEQTIALLIFIGALLSTAGLLSAIYYRRSWEFRVAIQARQGLTEETSPLTLPKAKKGKILIELQK